MTDRLVDVPGFGQVAFPDTMSDGDVVAAIERDIMPKARGGKSAPIGVQGPSPQAPANPEAKPSAPDYGGPGGTQRPWYEQPKTQEADPTTIFGRNIAPIQRNANLDARAVGRGLADVAGTPMDLATGGWNSLGAIVNKLGSMIGRDPGVRPVVNPPGGAEFIKEGGARALSAIGVPDPGPLSPKEKLSGHVIEGGTAAAAPAALLRRLALTAGRNGVASEQMNPLMKPYGAAAETAETMAPGPAAAYVSARPLMVDTAAGAGAGVGQHAAEEYAPNNPWVSMLASAAGGVTGATGFNLATAPAAAWTAVKDWMTRDAVTGSSKRVADQAAGTFQSAAIDPTAAAGNIRTKSNLYSEAGVANPTAGLMSGDEGLISLERGLRSNAADPKTAGLFAKKDKEVQTSLGEVVAGLGDQTANPRAATDFANTKAAGMRDQAQTGATQATGVVDATKALDKTEAANLALNIEKKGAASTTIDETVRGTLKDEKGIKNALYDEAKVAGQGVERSADPLAAAAQEVTDNIGKLNTPSKIAPQETIDRINKIAGKDAKPVDTGVLDAAGNPITRAAETETLSYGDILKLRPELRSAIETATRDGNGALAESLGKLKGAVEGEAKRIQDDAAKITQAGGPKTPAEKSVMEAADWLAKADENYKGVYKPNFVEGAGGKFREDVATDASRVLPSETGKRFLDKTETAADLKRIVEVAGNPKEAHQGIRDYLFSKVAQFATDGEKISETRLNVWLKKNKDIIDQYPQVAQELRDLQSRVATNKLQGSAAEAQLARAKGNLKLTDKDIQQSGLGLILDKDPHNAIEAVFKSGDPQKNMRSLTDQMGGKDAKSPVAQSWKRAVADYVGDSVSNTNSGITAEGIDPVSLAKFTKMLGRHDAALGEVFTPKEMSSLQIVRKAATDLASLGSVRATKGSNTAEDVKGAINAFEIIAKGTKGQLAGGGITRTAKLVLGNLGLMDEGVAVANVLSKAMHDPGLAAHLLERPVSKQDRSLWNSRLNALMGVAAAGRESGKE